jgi:hypothetical protein
VRQLRKIACVTVIVTAALLAAATVSAQTGGRVRVTRTATVMEQPRGDSLVLGSIAAGAVLQVLDQMGLWYLVAPTADTPSVPWKRAWIQANAIEFVEPRPTTRSRRTGDFMIRGFGQFGGALFTARDSFEAILDSPFGVTYGVGGQIVFRNGLFVEGDIDRFRKDGFRVVVSDNQLFRSALADTVTVTPLLATIGYRQQRASRTVGYVGAGVGWHILEEQSSSPIAPSSRDGQAGFHLVGGAEYPIAPFMWLAGEVQWATVPDGFGTSGVGTVFDEKDSGATTFRVKIVVGR